MQNGKNAKTDMNLKPYVSHQQIQKPSAYLLPLFSCGRKSLCDAK